jgi:hypothetical protein
MAEDVNDDGTVAPLDALQIVNTINNDGSRRLPTDDGGPSYYDVNDDGFVTPVDVVRVINVLNNGITTSEGEAGSDEPDIVVNVVANAAIWDSPSANDPTRLTSPLLKVESGVLNWADQPRGEVSAPTEVLDSFEKPNSVQLNALAEVIDELARDSDEEKKHVQAADDLFAEIGLFGTND